MFQSGSSAANAFSVYGAVGVPASTNVPGARWDYAMSFNSFDGNIYVFGGTGYALSYGTLNDLWRWSVTSNMWTCVSSGSAVNSVGVYTFQKLLAMESLLGGRTKHSMVIDPATGNLFVFGGTGTDSTGIHQIKKLMSMNSLRFSNYWTFQ